MRVLDEMKNEALRDEGTDRVRLATNKVAQRVGVL